MIHDNGPIPFTINAKERLPVMGTVPRFPIESGSTPLQLSPRRLVLVDQPRKLVLIKPHTAAPFALIHLNASNNRFLQGNVFTLRTLHPRVLTTKDQSIK